jgi:hypothetical protein
MHKILLNIVDYYIDAILIVDEYSTARPWNFHLLGNWGAGTVSLKLIIVYRG